MPHIHAGSHPLKNFSHLGIMANNMAIENALAFIKLSELYKCANVHVFGLWLNSTSPARRSQETKHQFSIRQLHMQLELCLKINSCSCKTSSCPPLTSKHSTLFPQPRMTSVLTCRHQVSFYMHGCNHFQKLRFRIAMTFQKSVGGREWQKQGWRQGFPAPCWNEMALLVKLDNGISMTSTNSHQ